MANDHAVVMIPNLAPIQPPDSSFPHHVLQNSQQTKNQEAHAWRTGHTNKFLQGPQNQMILQGASLPTRPATPCPAYHHSSYPPVPRWTNGSQVESHAAPCNEPGVYCLLLREPRGVRGLCGYNFLTKASSLRCSSADLGWNC